MKYTEAFWRTEKPVTSYAEVWIEIGISGTYWYPLVVTSYAEVWIEIGIHCTYYHYK